MAGPSAPSGPDLTQGIPLGMIDENGNLLGHVAEDAVLVSRRGDEYSAISATCSHYGGPLGEGLIDADTVRCPWHHACFSLRTGEAIEAPAFNPLSRWLVEIRGDKLYVREKIEPIPPRPRATAAAPGRVVIVGGGAAGFAAAEMLRRQGFGGSLTMVSSDNAPPYDRPNCSKDYLAGNAPEDWMPLRPPEYYRDNDIDLRLKTVVASIDARGHSVSLTDGKSLPFDKLLLATGAEPIRLDIPGANAPHVFVLRSLADSRAIIERAKSAKRAVVLGASFIGLEAAAALRARELEVHVAAPERAPLERVFGSEMAQFVRLLHEEHGVTFHMEQKATAIDSARVRLENGQTIDADLVIVGIGVRPRTALAERAALSVDRGISVNEYLQTSAPDIFAAGDIARWPDPYSGSRLRIEHWVVAERQGQTAARNMLGAGEKFTQVPFFWSQHYDVPINYVGHAEGWDDIAIEGDIAGRDCMLRYRRGGRVLAAASIYRDRESLEAEVAMEREVAS
ncbi:MAG: FAD-dependent oxidoreductase [Bradyrhizobiaceae bacterium]|nr:FAD-dependent oxidoreductase [Hyphomicrobiales bacterium]MBV9428447.1 FAD-dependent oxidoreductase [Bradyrhizobiaceae bacterium]